MKRDNTVDELVEGFYTEDEEEIFWLEWFDGKLGGGGREELLSKLRSGGVPEEAINKVVSLFSSVKREPDGGYDYSDYFLSEVRDALSPYVSTKTRIKLALPPLPKPIRKLIR